jgi:hypothetical protein
MKVSRALIYDPLFVESASRSDSTMHFKCIERDNEENNNNRNKNKLKALLIVMISLLHSRCLYIQIWLIKTTEPLAGTQGTYVTKHQCQYIKAWLLYDKRLQFPWFNPS